ncbi:MAG: hypothetical protein B6U94_06635 [Thermofilum sp. ex4484_79]|nr:MAG: hypothetical protein B6U94_06635 [Thermofilum sp. ex4484_79]
MYRLTLRHHVVDGYHVYLLYDDLGYMLANGIPSKDPVEALNFLKLTSPVKLSKKLLNRANRIHSCKTASYRHANGIVRLFLGEDVRMKFRVRFTGLRLRYIATLRTLRLIPRGKVTTYSELALYMDLKSPRVAAKALAMNPFPLVFPCHRVIRKDGGLGGYLDGREYVNIKAEILRREGVKVVNNMVPKEYIIELY